MHNKQVTFQTRKSKRFIHIQAIKKSDIFILQQILKFLIKYFMNDEPTNKCLNLSKNATDAFVEVEFYKWLMKNNLTVLARDEDDEIVGVTLNNIRHKDNRQSFNHSYPVSSFYRKVDDILEELAEKANVFNTYEVDQYFESAVMSISPKWQGEGISKMLVQYSKSLAKEYKVEVAFAICTNLFSAKSFQSCGYYEVFKRRFSDYKKSNGDDLFVIDKPHEYFSVNVCVLD